MLGAGPASRLHQRHKPGLVGVLPCFVNGGGGRRAEAGMCLQGACMHVCMCACMGDMLRLVCKVHA